MGGKTIKFSVADLPHYSDRAYVGPPLYFNLIFTDQVPVILFLVSTERGDLLFCPVFTFTWSFCHSF